MSAAWPGYRITLRHGGSWYDIELRNPHGATGGPVAFEHDGEPVTGPDGVSLKDDGARHRIVATLAAPAA